MIAKQEPKPTAKLAVHLLTLTLQLQNGPINKVREKTDTVFEAEVLALTG